eukprot:14931077-Ditylum_brightwellii.AAC.1
MSLALLLMLPWLADGSSYPPWVICTCNAQAPSIVVVADIDLLPEDPLALMHCCTPKCEILVVAKDPNLASLDGVIKVLQAL